MNQDIKRVEIHLPVSIIIVEVLEDPRRPFPTGWDQLGDGQPHTQVDKADIINNVIADAIGEPIAWLDVNAVIAVVVW